MPGTGGQRWIPALLFLSIILAALPVLVAADDWVGGLPLRTVQTGTVTGDLWISGNPAPNWGDKNVVRTFTLPTAAVAEPGRIRWARLYISAYCGHMQNDYPFTITNRFDGNGDGTYETTWAETGHAPFHFLRDPLTPDETLGNDNTASGGGLHDPYKIINDHETRVTSDYYMWYDVTDLIRAQTVRVDVDTTGSFDGRIKVITLVVAYDDPASTTETRYWVNQGHDSCSYYTEDNLWEVAVGKTSFGTQGIGTFTSARLIVDYMASNNGYYGFPSESNDFDAVAKTGRFNTPLDRTPDAQGQYSGSNSWDVTSQVLASPNRDVTLAYARYLPATGLAAFYKIPLAILVVKSPMATPAPVADFTAIPLSGNAPLTVTFSDRSSDTPTSWKWEYNCGGGWTEFGNGAKNPSHTFTAGGASDIRLTATNAGGSSTKIRTAYIVVSAPGSSGNTLAISGVIQPHAAPVAAFSASPVSGTTPLRVQFTDQSTGGPTGWAWDFDNDGTVDSTQQNPSYTYTAAGTYAVKLTATNDIGSDDEVRAGSIAVTAPSEAQSAMAFAAFIATPTSGTAPLTVQFTDQSTGIPWFWRWDFGDGNTSTSRSPSYTYCSPGIYVTSLAVSADAATWTIPAVRTITVSTASGIPGVTFTASPTSGTAPLTVQFRDSSSGSPISWAWDFENDGTGDSTEQNPVHTYSAAGTYSVRLTASNAIGSNSQTRSGYITVTGSSTPPDLAVDTIVPNLGSASGGNVFALEQNRVTVRISNLGAGPSDATTVKLASSDGFSGTTPVPALAAGANTTVVITDTTIRSMAGGSVTYTATVDPDHKIPESSESNNGKTGPAITVRYNGYKGKRFWPGGGDIVTRHTFDLNGSLLYSRGDSVYRSGSFGEGGWLSYTVHWDDNDLQIPGNATVRAAYLYVPYTWDNENIAPDHTFLDFNGYRMTRSSWDWDKSNFGVYADYVYGLLTYDVTSEFRKNLTNSALFTRENPKYSDRAQAAVYTKISMYEFFLVVVYEDPAASRRQIFINEGFDLLGASPEYATNEVEATAYVPFTGMTIDTGKMKHATLITFVPSGDSHEGNLLYNSNIIAPSVWDYGGTGTGEEGIPEVAVDTREVGSYIRSTVNTFGIQSTDRGGTPCMAASQQFLIVDYGGGTNHETVSQPVVPVTLTLNATNITPITATGIVNSGPVTGDFEGMQGVNMSWSADITGLSGLAGSITTSILRSPGNETVAAYDQVLSRQNLTMRWLAYAAMVNKTGVSSVGEAAIEMSLPGNLVEQYGGTDAFRILREGDDGTTEVLNTTFTGYEQGTGYLSFQGISPHGLSCFSLVALGPRGATPAGTQPALPAANESARALETGSVTDMLARSGSRAAEVPVNLTGTPVGNEGAWAAIARWFSINALVGGLAVIGATGVFGYRIACGLSRDANGIRVPCDAGPGSSPGMFDGYPAAPASESPVIGAGDRLHLPHFRIPRVLLILSIIAAVAIPLLAISYPVLVKTGPNPVSSGIQVSSFDILPTVERIEDLDRTNHAPDYPLGFSARNGLLAVPMGTGKYRISDLALRLSNGENEVILTSSASPPAVNALGPSHPSYFEEIGNGDGTLDPGEWLMIYADNCYDSSLAEDGPGGRALTWQPEGSARKVEVQVGDVIGYSLKDTGTGSVLQQGTIHFVPP
jgi:PKD repeat protein